MKRIIIIQIMLLFFSFPIFADGVTITDESVEDSFKSENFIPNEVQSVLNENNLDINSPHMAKDVLGLVSGAIKAVFSDFSKNIALLLIIIVFVSLFYKFIDNKPFKTIISYIITLVVLIEVFGITKNIILNVSDTLSSVSQILSAVLPAFSAVLLMGGSTFTTFTQSASFGAVLTLLNHIINTLLVPCLSLIMLIMVFERLSPQLSELNLLRFFRKNTITVIAFITMIMLTVISYQHIISAGKDSVSGRTVKFAAANFIPIVGAAFGESLRTISAGLKYLKNTVGGAVALSLIITVLPVILQIFLVKIYFNFLSFAAGLMGCKSEQGVFDASVSVFDILNAIIICAAILSLLLIITFVLSVFPVST